MFELIDLLAFLDACTSLSFPGLPLLPPLPPPCPSLPYNLPTLSTRSLLPHIPPPSARYHPCLPPAIYHHHCPSPAPHFTLHCPSVSLSLFRYRPSKRRWPARYQHLLPVTRRDRSSHNKYVQYGLHVQYG